MFSSPHGSWSRIRIVAALAVLGCAASLRAQAASSLHPGMAEVKLAGLTVWLGQPIEVSTQIGWGDEVAACLGRAVLFLLPPDATARRITFPGSAL